MASGGQRGGQQLTGATSLCWGQSLAAVQVPKLQEGQPGAGACQELGLTGRRRPEEVTVQHPYQEKE